jgi:hypothetical protein
MDPLVTLLQIHIVITDGREDEILPFTVLNKTNIN